MNKTLQIYAPYIQNLTKTVCPHKSHRNTAFSRPLQNTHWETAFSGPIFARPLTTTAPCLETINNRHPPFSKMVTNTVRSTQDTNQRCCSHCNKVHANTSGRNIRQKQNPPLQEWQTKSHKFKQPKMPLPRCKEHSQHNIWTKQCYRHKHMPETWDSIKHVPQTSKSFDHT